jgi:anti-sigma regulatory factor (Ser/Thr protein kinase)
VDGCSVLRAVGVLDVMTYRPLRDALVKLAVEQPKAVVVDLTDLDIGRESALTVFASAWMRVSDWPGVPILLAAGTERHRAVLPGAVSRYVPHYPTVLDAVAAAASPPRVSRTTLDLEATDVAGRLARVFARDTCDAWGLPHLTPDVVAIATELVENVVRHAHTPAQLRLELRPRALTVAVRDDSPRAAVLRERRPGEYAGNGLRLVSHVAAVWGCTPHRSGGKVVWANLARVTRAGHSGTTRRA